MDIKFLDLFNFKAQKEGIKKKKKKKKRRKRMKKRK